MKITDVRAVNVCVPLSTFGTFEPVTMWYGTRFAALKTIIFLETNAGLIGLGVAIHEERFEAARRRYELELDRWQHVRERDPRVPSRQFYYWHDYPKKHEWPVTEWPYRV